MNVKKHLTQERRLMLAVCDSELKGKKFEQNDLQLDLTSKFYDGEEMAEEQILELIKEAYIVNLVGEKSVSLGIKTKIITEDHIIKIDGIPHAQAVITSKD